VKNPNGKKPRAALGARRRLHCSESAKS